MLDEAGLLPLPQFWPGGLCDAPIAELSSLTKYSIARGGLTRGQNPSKHGSNRA